MTHACSEDAAAPDGSLGSGASASGSSGDAGRSGSAGVASAGAAGAAGSGAAGSGAAPLGSCDAYAASYCERLAECAPYYVRRTYEDSVTCVPLLTQVCEADAADSIGASDLAECTRALADADCEELLGDPLPGCERAPGDLAVGDPCQAPAQCESGSCAFSGNVCGTCTRTLEAEAPCEGVLQGCAPGLGCDVEGSGQCQPLQRREQGQSCDSSLQVCAPGLFCSSSATCRPLLEDRAACVAEPSGCDGRRALFCLDGVCGPLAVFVEPGEPCGVDGSPFPRCGDPFYCDPDSNDCVRRARAGEPCEADPVAGSTCEVDLTCVQGECVTYAERCL